MRGSLEVLDGLDDEGERIVRQGAHGVDEISGEGLELDGHRTEGISRRPSPPSRRPFP
jgi:hypothetical protein